MKLDKTLVLKIAGLAKIPISEKEADELLSGFNKTLEVIDNLFSVDVKNVEPLHQTTFLENVFRDDVVDEKSMLQQDEALKGSKNKYNGYFVVDQVLEED